MQNIRRHLGLIIGVMALFVSRTICLLLFYLGLLTGKKTILYISDSRGFLVGSLFSYKNHFKNCLISGLQKNYAVLPIINRQKHTTLLDGLDFINNSRSKFDLIVLHLGVVDFSPRSFSSAELIRAKKISSLANKPIYNLENGCEEVSISLDLTVREPATYEGEQTDAIANGMYIKKVKDMMNEIPQPMIAITTNNVDLTWRGNYWRDRPNNMNSYLSVERSFWSETGIPCISLNDCSETVYETTLDNIHPSKLGFQKLEQLVRTKIAKLY